jgi:hypothetical protein
MGAPVARGLECRPDHPFYSATDRTTNGAADGDAVADGKCDADGDADLHRRPTAD